MHLCYTQAFLDVWGKLELFFKKHWILISKTIKLLFVPHYEYTFYVEEVSGNAVHKDWIVPQNRQDSNQYKLDMCK